MTNVDELITILQGLKDSLEDRDNTIAKMGGELQRRERQLAAHMNEIVSLREKLAGIQAANDGLHRDAEEAEAGLANANANCDRYIEKWKGAVEAAQKAARERARECDKMRDRLFVIAAASREYQQ